MRAVPGVLLFALALQTSSASTDGVAALNDGDPAKAVAPLERAVAADPAARLALLDLANAQAANRQLDAASATLKQVLRLNPDGADSAARRDISRGYAITVGADGSVFATGETTGAQLVLPTQGAFHANQRFASTDVYVMKFVTPAF